MKQISREIKNYLLWKELERAGDFFIGGYNDQMVLIYGKNPSRFLNELEVKQVLKWREEGKIEESGTRSVTSEATGITYTYKNHRIKPKNVKP